MIAIIDYGMGNLKSIHNALTTVAGSPVIIPDSRALAGVDADVDAIVIPGVGAFGDAMRNLSPFADALFDLVDSGMPVLGICIGMQVLLDRSEEGDAAGFGLIRGDVVRLPDSVRIPQMGWNELTIHRDSDLLAGIEDGDFFYFVHSYYCVLKDEKAVVATTDYGVDMAAVVEKDNIHAVQFHPEKSSKKGLVILKNFVEMTKC